MALDFTPITDQVTRLTTVDQSVVTLLNDLAAKVEATKGDPAAVQTVADQIRDQADALAAAVAANTPAADKR